jgi:hypothetical protein
MGLVMFFLPRYDWLCLLSAYLYNLNKFILCRTTTPGVPTNTIFGQSTQPTFGQPTQPTFGQSIQPTFGQSTRPTFGQSATSTPSFGTPTFGNAGMKFGTQGICLN